MEERYKTKIKVNNITHLTDARYFAAMGVDFMGFNLKNIEKPELTTELQKIAAIREWISGPELFVSINQPDEALMELFFEYQLFYIECQKQNNWSSTENFHWFFTEESAPLIDQSFRIINDPALIESQTSPFWLKIDPATFKPKEIETLIQHSNLTGLQLEGSPEEKIGVKVYDAYDAFFEFLEL